MRGVGLSGASASALNDREIGIIVYPLCADTVVETEGLSPRMIPLPTPTHRNYYDLITYARRRGVREGFNLSRLKKISTLNSKRKIFGYIFKYVFLFFFYPNLF